jgi:hypothetical protein
MGFPVQGLVQAHIGVPADDITESSTGDNVLVNVTLEGLLEPYSKPHVMEKKNSPRAASYASR